MKKSYRSRWLSIFLAAILSLGMIPAASATVYAEEIAVVNEEEPEEQRYTLTVTNGGSKTTSQSAYVSVNEVTAGTTVSVRANELSSDQAFGKWVVDENSTAVSIPDNYLREKQFTITMPEGDVSLTAQIGRRVNNASITVAEPRAGEALSYTAATSEGLHVMERNNNYTLNGVMWQSGRTVLKPTTDPVAACGNTYKVTVYVEPDEGYAFDRGSMTRQTFSINGEDPVVFNSYLSGTEAITVMKTFTVSHEMSLVPAVDASCTEAGSEAYYICSTCSKWFRDAAGSEEITDHESVVIPAGHVYQDAWTGDETGHCHKCLNCSDTTTVEEHIAGPAATETSPQTCTVCGYVLQPIITEFTQKDTVAITVPEPVPGETLGTPEVSDPEALYRSNYFWYDLNSEQNDTAVCGGQYSLTVIVETKDGYRFPVDEEGNPAAAATINGQSASVTITSSNEPSRRIAVDLTFSVDHTLVEVPAKAATCTEDGCEAYYRCTTCEACFGDPEGETKITDLASIAIPAAHTYKDEWAGTENGHFHECMNCSDTTAVEEHVPGPVATETSPQTCTVCGYILQPNITEFVQKDSVAITVPEPVLGEALGVPEVSDSEALYRSNYFWYNMNPDQSGQNSTAVCGGQYSLTVIVETKDGYRFPLDEDGNPAAAATINGQPARVTATSSEEPSRRIAVNLTFSKEHTAVEVSGKAATCTEEGLTAGAKCSTCGAALLEQEVIEKIPHAFGNYVEDQNATFAQNGTRTGVCEICGETDTVEIPGSKLAVGMPKLTKAVNDKSGVKVTWESSEYAGKYRLYYKGGSISKWTKVTDTTATSYVVTGLTSGTTYTFTVRAYDSTGKYSSSYDTAGIGILYLSSITPAISNVSTGLQIKWTKVAGAVGYYVYRKEGTAYKKIKTITSGSTVSYIDTSIAANNGTAYNYCVKAYNGKTYGTYTAKSYYRLTGISISSLTNISTRKLVVKWAKNTKAAGYQVQYATNSSFTSAKTVTVTGASSLTTTLSSLTKGSTYYVRVRAYKTNSSGTKYYSAWSAKKYLKITK